MGEGVWERGCGRGGEGEGVWERGVGEGVWERGCGRGSTYNVHSEMANTLT